VIRYRRPVLLLLAALAFLVACGGSREDRLALRMLTDHYTLRILPTPVPPRAREKTRYKVVVRDRKSGQPIEGGEGIIYANTRDGASTWDSFVPGEELGTYYATLNFVVSGEWAIGIRFRRDSTQRLEQVDWMQEVLGERASIP
jgi:hypothetical protein